MQRLPTVRKPENSRPSPQRGQRPCRPAEIGSMGGQIALSSLMEGVFAHVLRLDFDRRSIRHHSPDFIHVGIGNPNAAIGPVDQLKQPAPPAKAVGLAMDHDVPAGIDAGGLGGLDLSGVGIGDMDRLVGDAAGIAPVEEIAPLRRALVTLPVFLPDGIAA